MKTYIYMNHHIRDKANLKSRTPEPPITVQKGKHRIHANSIFIKGPSEVGWGELPAHGHVVHAWIETDSEVEVLG